jgi:hypothetical protein
VSAASGHSLLAADTDDANDDADDRRPKRKSEQQTRTDRIGIGIGPQADCSGENDEQ